MTRARRCACLNTTNSTRSDLRGAQRRLTANRIVHFLQRLMQSMQLEMNRPNTVAVESWRRARLLIAYYYTAGDYRIRSRDDRRVVGTLESTQRVGIVLA